MAYKKYIKRNGKLYGPYVYHSKRVDGKVISEYRGSQGEPSFNKKKSLYLIIAGVLILAILFWGIIFSFNLTGRATLDFNSYMQGDVVSGKFDLLMYPGELIPANSQVVIENGPNRVTYPISDLVTQTPVVANYYFKNSNLSGTGEGYGFVGKNETKETVFFRLEVYPSSTGGGATIKTNETVAPTNDTTSNETITNVTPTNDTIVNDTATDTTTTTTTNDTTTTTTTTEPTTTTTTDNTSTSTDTTTTTEPAPTATTTEPTTTADTTTTSNTSSVTGNVISNLFLGVGKFFTSLTGRAVDGTSYVQGDATVDKSFTYTAPDNYVVGIEPGSVHTNSAQLNDTDLFIARSGNDVVVSTNYSLVDYGFGEAYLGNQENYLTLDFGKVGLNLTEGQIIVRIVYNDTTLVEYTGSVSMAQALQQANATNETNMTDLAKQIFNQTNYTYNWSQLDINLTDAEKSILKNKFGFIVVNTNASNYRDKIIVTFSIGDYSESNSYDANMNKTILDRLVARDRILWLKDIANQLSTTKDSYVPIPNMSSMDTIA
jgi:hypothetical protein